MALALVFMFVQGKAQSTTSSATTSRSSMSDANGPRLGIGIDGGIATNSEAGFILGGDLRYQQPVGKSVSLLLTAGYTNFFKKTSTYFPNIGVVPVKAGVKIFPAKNLYVDGEVGAGFFTNSGGGTSFVFSPAIGYAFDNGLDLSVKYEDFTKYDFSQQVALRIAYGFKL